MRIMKDSGIEWVKDIPSTWDVAYLSAVLSERKNKNIGMKENNLLSLSYGNVIRKDITTNDGLLPESFEGYNIIEKDDIVLRLTDLQNDHRSLRTGLCKERGIITSAYCTLKKNSSKYDSRFLQYYLHSFDICKGFYGMGAGVRQGLNYDGIRKIEILLPPLAEQIAIADCIEEKTKKVDALIANQEAQIEKLKAYKQSIITEAVTKGFDPNVQMKDSGVDEIGCIPENYDIRKTLLCLDMPITDGPHTTPELFDEGIPFVSAEAVSCGNGGIDFSHIRGYISQEFYEECCKKYIPQIDDIYMIKSGATTGRVSIVSTDEVFTIWSPLAVFRCNSEVVVPKYLFYYLQSKCYQQQVELGWSYGTQQNIGMRTLEKLKVVVPPLDIQNRIIEYLDHQFEKTNELISIKQLKIEKLNQYKKSLIYEYVTGKKEVSC